MPIKVACQCGASFAAKDELAGKRVRCPKCKQPLTIPGGQPAAAAPAAKRAPATQRAPAPAAKTAMDDLFDEIGMKAAQGPRCPQCNAPLKPNAVLCVECGFNLQAGTKVEGVKVVSAGHGGHEDTAESILDSAAKELESDQEEARKSTSSGAPFYVYLFFILALLAFGGMMLTIPRPMAFYNTGIGMLAFAGLQLLYYRIRFIISAFFETAAQGFLVLFVPFYDLFYLITRWDRVGLWFVKALASCGILGLGFVFMWMAPFFARKESKAPRPEPPTVIVRVDTEFSSRMQS